MRWHILRSYRVLAEVTFKVILKAIGNQGHPPSTISIFAKITEGDGRQINPLPPPQTFKS